MIQRPFSGNGAGLRAALAPRRLPVRGSSTISVQQAMIALAIALSSFVGGFAVHRGAMAVPLTLAVLALLGLIILGDRAFAWFLVAASVAPWYPFISYTAVPPRVPERDLVAAIALAPLVPWLWSLGRKQRSAMKYSAWPLFLGILYLGYAVIIYDTVGGFKPMVDSQVAAFLFLGITFLCARRFGDPSSWLAASVAGLIVLIAMGADAQLTASGNRIGYFVGYPITYAALIVALLPSALVFVGRRSRWLALALVVAAALMLLWSQSRSSWAALVVMLALLALVLARRREVRMLVLITGAVAVVVGVVLLSSSLRTLVTEKLSSNVASSDSVTHRVWSLQFGLQQVGRAPLLGNGGPGYGAKLTANETGISAIDNGYVSVMIDMGIFGLIGCLVPIVIALIVLSRSLVAGRAPPADLALALGVVGLAVVTLFYDSFYWPSITLLMGGMAGVLSTRLHLSKTPRVTPV